jgi:hypothetical protein
VTIAGAEKAGTPVRPPGMVEFVSHGILVDEIRLEFDAIVKPQIHLV